jgi:hypothetical protein
LPLAFGVAFYFVAGAPQLMTYLSARHLYLPSAGLAIAAGCLLFSSRSALALRTALALAVALLLVPRLRALEGEWIEAGRDSRVLRAEIERVTRDAPKQAVVVLAGVKSAQDDVLAWRSALPFALRPPFVARDVTADLQLLESPDLHCCPVAHWWQAHAAALDALETGAPDAEVALYLADWKPEARRLAWRQARLPRAALLERLERAGLERAQRRSGWREAGRLVATLAQLVRGAPRDRPAP